MAKNGKADISDVSAEIESLKSDVATLTALLTDIANDEAGKAKGDAKNLASKLKSAAEDQATMAQVRAAEMGEQARVAAEKGYAKTEEAVRQQPGVAIGVAAGVGFLIGLFAARRA